MAHINTIKHLRRASTDSSSSTGSNSSVGGLSASGSPTLKLRHHCRTSSPVPQGIITSSVVAVTKQQQQQQHQTYTGSSVIDMGSSDRGLYYRQVNNNGGSGRNSFLITDTRSSNNLQAGHPITLPFRPDLDRAEQEVRHRDHQDLIQQRSAERLEAQSKALLLERAKDQVQVMSHMLVEATRYQREQLALRQYSDAPDMLDLTASSFNDPPAMMGRKMATSPNTTKMLLHDVKVLLLNKKGIDRFPSVKQQLSKLHLWW